MLLQGWAHCSPIYTRIIVARDSLICAICKMRCAITKSNMRNLQIFKDVSSKTSSWPRVSSRKMTWPWPRQSSPCLGLKLLALKAWPWPWKSSITTFSFALSYCPLFNNNNMKRAFDSMQLINIL